MTWQRVFRANPGLVDKSDHPTVIEYAVQEMFKKKSPRAAARATAKKLSGGENLFLGPGVATIDAVRLEQNLWQRLVDFTMKAKPHYKPGISDLFIAQGTALHFGQKPEVAEEIARRMFRANPGFKPGDPVEVRVIWAGGAGGPHYTWSKNYEFVRETPRGVLVRQTRGTFTGVESLSRREDVRPAMTRENPLESSVEAAVKAWQLYMGSEGLPIKTQQRFYNKASKLTEKVAKKHGLSYPSASQQITDEAGRRGRITPRPGKDY